MAISVPGGRQWVDRVDVVPGVDERTDQEAAVYLDADHDLGRLLDVFGNHRVQSANPGHVVAHLAPGEHIPLLVQDADVVMGLRPVDPHEDHAPSFLRLSSSLEGHPRRANGSVLVARHPTGRCSPHRPAGARSRSRARRLCGLRCSPAGGSGPSMPEAASRVPLAARAREGPSATAGHVQARVSVR